jgi:hypothetical protein
MFPPIGAAVPIDAIRAGTLDAPEEARVAPPDTTTASPATTTAPPETIEPDTTVAATPAPPSTVTTVVDNEFLPERDLDECISALPQPDCGSAGRGGWRQFAILGLVAVAIAFIAWRIIRSVRKGRTERTTTDDA